VVTFKLRVALHDSLYNPKKYVAFNRIESKNYVVYIYYDDIVNKEIISQANNMLLVSVIRTTKWKSTTTYMIMNQPLALSSLSIYEEEDSKAKKGEIISLHFRCITFV
jgi:hypothetical protein